MLLEGPVLCLSFAAVALAIFVLRLTEAVRHFQPEPAGRSRALHMSRVEITPARGLGGEAARDAQEDVRPLSWLSCVLLLLLASAFCYGLGYIAIAELLHGGL
jgi:hypothetical protein